MMERQVSAPAAMRVEPASLDSISSTALASLLLLRTLETNLVICSRSPRDNPHQSRALSLTWTLGLVDSAPAAKVHFSRRHGQSCSDILVPPSRASLRLSTTLVVPGVAL